MILQGNLVNLAGRAGKDADVKYFESGSVVANISMAVNRPQKDAPPDWFQLQFWGKTAEVAANYLKKGSLFAVTGQLGLEAWTDKTTGEPRSRPIIRVDRLTLLGSAQSNSGYEEF